jgi:GNAT superfamily N-acetyltransferase
LSYEIAKYSPEFRDGVLALQRYSWSPDPVQNNAYFHWKHECCPYLDSPLIYLALYKGTVVGMRGMYGTRWEVGGSPEVFRALCAADLVVAPDHRNRGLFPLIMKAALQDLDRLGYQYVLNLSASPVTFVSSLAVGWRSTGSLQGLLHQSRETLSRRLERRLPQMPLLWRFRDPFSAYLLRRKLRAFNRVTNQRAAAHVVVDSSPRPEAMAELVERIGGDGRIRHVRDAQYLTWRYQNPLSRYRFLFWMDARMEGYLVLEIPVPAYSSGHRVSIVDWEGTSPEVCSDLLQCVVNHPELEEVFVWSGTFSAKKRDLLVASEFRPALEPGRMSRHRPCALIRSVRDEDLSKEWSVEGKPLLDLSSWDLRQLYSL